MIDLAGYTLTFADEFDARSISQNGADTKWADIRSEWRLDKNADIGFGRSSFVDAASGYDPFKVADGILTITAVPDKTPFGYPGSWESGLITTQGVFSQKYGYFEMRADMSSTKGSWDAFWLLPDKQTRNPFNPSKWQELDVVEHYGAWDRGVYSAIHTTDLDKQDYSSTQSYAETSTTSGFHTYGVLWTEKTISFYLDGRLTSTKATPSDMHTPMHILANLAVEDGADPNGDPLQMKIDYIRAYAANGSPDLAHFHIGTPGDDRLIGDTSDDVFRPLGGFNTVDGGSGHDILELAGAHSSYTYLSSGGIDYLYRPGELDKIMSVEEVHFADMNSSWSDTIKNMNSFEPSAYVASYADLIKAFGIDTNAAVQHFVNWGFRENRTVTFDSLDYIASYTDLIQAFGADATRGAQHFIRFGANEGRTVTFNGLEYIASYSDLIQAFGADATMGAQHFMRWGVNEGRTVTFDAKAYAAANADVALVFGNDAEALARHYVTYGFAEGRSLGLNAAPAVSTVSAAYVDTVVDHPIPAAAFSSSVLDHFDAGHHGAWTDVLSFSLPTDNLVIPDWF